MAMLQVFEVQVLVQGTPTSGDFTVSIPHGATILSVNNRRNIISLCALGDTAQPMENRTIIARASYESLPVGKTVSYLGTATLGDGSGFLYYFEVKP